MTDHADLTRAFRIFQPDQRRDDEDPRLRCFELAFVFFGLGCRKCFGLLACRLILQIRQNIFLLFVDTHQNSPHVLKRGIELVEL